MVAGAPGEHIREGASRTDALGCGRWRSRTRRRTRIRGGRCQRESRQPLFVAHHPAGLPLTSRHDRQRQPQVASQIRPATLITLLSGEHLGAHQRSSSRVLARPFMAAFSALAGSASRAMNSRPRANTFASLSGWPDAVFRVSWLRST